MNKKNSGAFLLLCLMPALASGQTLELQPYGKRAGSSKKDQGKVSEVRMFKIVIGDPSWQDAVAMTASKSGDIASLNAALYQPNTDGTWRVQNYGRPDDGKSMDDPSAFPEHERYGAYRSRRDVRLIVRRSEEVADFGQPGDYFYKRGRMLRSELPQPFNRMSPRALAPVRMILRYNANGAMKIYLQEPYDEDGVAQVVLERMNTEADGRWDPRPWSGISDVCRFQRIEGSDCVYQCDSGRPYRRRARQADPTRPNDPAPIACDYIVIPF